MKSNLFFALLAALLMTFSATAKSPTELASLAIDDDPAVAAQATAELRAFGQSGLDALFDANRNAIAKFTQTGDGGRDWPRIATAIDGVAMQKDAFSSRLFWFTDLEAAKAAAKTNGKPILSLRLLGKLNEEFSCANSRFFRALLYSNSAVANELRENYILHWQTVRPAPRLTIDFGDGRRIERTITGNSIHYILDSNGEIIDALPGLYSPQTFLANLKYDSALIVKIAKMTPESRAGALFLFRQETLKRIQSSRTAAIAKANVKLVEPTAGTTAIEVAPRAVTKLATEVPFLTDDFGRFEKQMGLEEWRKVAAIYAADTSFDEPTLRFISRQNSKSGVDLAKLTVNLRAFVAVDTTRNDFLFRPKLIEWLGNPRKQSLDAFNKRVYDELFKTPDADRWLGLYQNDVYTALDGNGIIDK